MRLYFLRHGIAEERRQDQPDETRQLTDEGRDEMRGVARGMAALDLKIGVILTSPLARALQTAEIAAHELRLQKRLRPEPLLASGCTAVELLRAVEDYPDDARILLVGHEPDFSEAISTLIGGGALRVKKASLACVELYARAPGRGELRWFLTPKQLRLMGKTG